MIPPEIIEQVGVESMITCLLLLWCIYLWIDFGLEMLHGYIVDRLRQRELKL